MQSMHHLNITDIREQIISKITIIFSMQAYHELHACSYGTRMLRTVCDELLLFIREVYLN